MLKRVQVQIGQAKRTGVSTLEPTDAPFGQICRVRLKGEKKSREFPIEQVEEVS